MAMSFWSTFQIRARLFCRKLLFIFWYRSRGHSKIKRSRVEKSPSVPSNPFSRCGQSFNVRPGRFVLELLDISCELAVTALFVSAGLFELRKLQCNHTRLGSSFRLGNVCGAVKKFRPSTAFTRLFLLQDEPLGAKLLQMDDDR